MPRLRRASLVLPVLMAVGLLGACGSDESDDDTEVSAPTRTVAAEPTPEPTETVDRSTLRAATSATISTSLGDIQVTLFPDVAPITVDNFLGLADGSKPWAGQQNGEPLYQDVIFHRVIAGFMIQGGDPEGTGFGGPGYRFRDEIGPTDSFDRPYLLAMANSGPGTNGSQFFITVTPTQHLDGLHTIFGEVTDPASRAVVDAINAVPTEGQNKPVEDVVIRSVTATG